MSKPTFQEWCRSRGFSAQYREDVIEKDRSQAEFTLTLAQYLGRVLTHERIFEGKQKLVDFADALAVIEKRFGVPAEIIVAIWGVETRFGAIMGDVPILDALATLAYDGRRSAFFESQLEAILPLLETEIDVTQITGSWAGAFGHTQFMPTSYRDFACSFSGADTPVLWGNDPLDALASAANYLKLHHWSDRRHWGEHVTLPDQFDFTMLGRGITKSASEWAELNVRSNLDQAGLSLILPMGVKGPAFLVGANFTCLETYNRSETYVFAVCLLADALADDAPMLSWPMDEAALTRAERVELQAHLTKAGFDTFGADGIFGPNTFNALRAYQKEKGLIPDGFPSVDLLQRLRS